jgi:hypothetical protein
MVNYILKRYELKQKISELQNKATEYSKVEKLLDKVIIFNELKKVDMREANRFKRLNLDNRKDGLFRTRIKNGLKIDIPELEYKYGK